MTAVHVATPSPGLLTTTSMVRGYWLAVCLLLLCGSGWVMDSGEEDHAGRGASLPGVRVLAGLRRVRL